MPEGRSSLVTAEDTLGSWIEEGDGERRGVPGRHAVELGQASRNHGMHLEGLRYDVTPPGMHYLVIHFDIPPADEAAWTVEVDGLVERASLSVDDLRSRPAVTRPVTMECAGNGRTLMPPRAESQPWPGSHRQRRVDRDAAPADPGGGGSATGRDRARLGRRPRHPGRRRAGLPVGLHARRHPARRGPAGVRDERPAAPPSTGTRSACSSPTGTGCSVKACRITAVAEPFDGFQLGSYQLRQEQDGPGCPSRGRPRALMVPPGFTDFPGRQRFLDAGPCDLIGRAWSGSGHVVRVEISVDGGGSWFDAEPGPPPASFTTWRAWSFRWDATPGEHELGPGDRRHRERPAAGGAVELRRLHEQHGAARARARPLTIELTPATEFLEAAVDVLFRVEEMRLIRSPSPRKSVHTSRASSWWQIFSASDPT